MIIALSSVTPPPRIPLCDRCIMGRCRCCHAAIEDDERGRDLMMINTFCNKFHLRLSSWRCCADKPTQTPNVLLNVPQEQKSERGCISVSPDAQSDHLSFNRPFQWCLLNHKRRPSLSSFTTTLLNPPFWLVRCSVRTSHIKCPSFLNYGHFTFISLSVFLY